MRNRTLSIWMLVLVPFLFVGLALAQEVAMKRLPVKRAEPTKFGSDVTNSETTFMFVAFASDEAKPAFSAEQVAKWREQLSTLCQPPKSTPKGWSKSKLDPVQLLTVFPTLHVRKGYVLRAYQFKEGSNANGFVWALPADAPYPEPDDCPRIESHALNPPKPFDALDDTMEAIEGDDSSASYLHASLLRRQLKDFGAEWHGIQWGAHTVLDGDPWKEGAPREDDGPFKRPNSKPGEWKWFLGKPEVWRPEVRMDDKQVVVTFHTFTPLARIGKDGKRENERILRHTDTYRRGKYRALVHEVKLAEGPQAIAF